MAYMVLLLRFFTFLRFSKFKKSWLFTFFALSHTFSRTMVDAAQQIQRHDWQWTHTPVGCTTCVCA